MKTSYIEGMNSDEVKECFTECTKAFGMELRRQLTKHRKKKFDWIHTLRW